MAEEFRLDPDGVAAGTKRLKTAGGRLNTAVTALNVVLDDHDGCWGTDDIGKAFEQKYVQPATDVRKYGADAGTGIVTTGENLDSASTTFQSVDHEHASRIDRTPPPA
ncbi:ESX-1 secretion-associated protein [Actinokineospora sp. PR83]|uniref:WXG100 family type VII secretion target n=1 Tax=Actinokineospora sp. PR83 TaxID=2884908 RepID=UPI001F48B1C5|nr:ESX-1 secretion-associated protein [Actinokineospora sp. PR83]MCG8916456.1 ESX-1 secretion-associated protein [Actinokineospora sp. PR83]